jgi:membrane-bound serine protease (ClpP class)
LRLIGLALVLLPLLSLGVAWRQDGVGPAPAHAQAQQNTVFVLQISGEIDLGLAAYLARALREAEAANAQAVVLEIDTPGGRLDAVLQMRDVLIGSPLRTIAFVDRTAFSAGALIALAAQEIYMAPGAVMGAATPVGGEGETASEKVVSAVRSTFRSTAELRGRDPRIAEAMVDPAVEIPGLIGPGQLLTLTTVEAVARGYAEGVSATRQELLSATGLTTADVRETLPGLAENVVRFLTTPVVASLLISLGMLLIIGDFSSGGVGIAGAAGMGLLAAFFWGHYLAGLAGWEGIVLVLLGLVLIGVEVFLIPGFGIAGLLGAVSLVGGLFLSLIGDYLVTPDDLLRAATTIGLAFILVFAGGFFLLRYLPVAHRFSGLVLHAQVDAPVKADGTQQAERARRGWLSRWIGRGSSGSAVGVESPAPPSPRPASLLGASGVALSDLRPGGIAEIAGERVDVVTRGDYVVAGEPIEVIADEGYRRVVRRLTRHPVPSGGKTVSSGGEPRVDAPE